MLEHWFPEDFFLTAGKGKGAGNAQGPPGPLSWFSGDSRPIIVLAFGSNPRQAENGRVRLREGSYLDRITQPELKARFCSSWERLCLFFLVGKLQVEKG